MLFLHYLMYQIIIFKEDNEVKNKLKLQMILNNTEYLNLHTKYIQNKFNVDNVIFLII